MAIENVDGLGHFQCNPSEDEIKQATQPVHQDEPTKKFKYYLIDYV
jgi:hypothetical protein